MFQRIFHNPALQIADFRYLAVATASNGISMSAEQVVFSLLIFQITDSSAWVGIALALYFGSSMAVGILAGALADWLDRRQLLRLAEIISAVNFLFAAMLLLFNWFGLSQLLIIIFISGTMRALQHPVRISYAYDLVGGQNITASLGLLNLSARSGQLVGALGSGIAMQYIGIEYTYFMLAVTHLLTFILLLYLRTVGQAAAPKTTAPLRQVLRDYLTELRINQVLLTLIIITAMVEILGFSFVTVLPQLAAQQLHLGAEALGIMYAARACGGIIASLIWAGTGSLRQSGKLFLGVIFTLALGLFWLAYAVSFTLILSALLLIAIMTVSSDVLSQSMMQLCVANQLRGRAMGAWQLAIGAAPLGHLLMGFLAATVGIATALAVNAAGLILIALIALILVPQIRHY